VDDDFRGKMNFVRIYNLWYIHAVAMMLRKKLLVDNKYLQRRKSTR